MDSENVFAESKGYPFPTPEVSVPPEYQELYNEWLKQRDAKESVTTEDRIRAVRENPQAMTKIAVLGVFMALLAAAMMIVFRRIAAKRRALEKRLTGCTKGRIVKIRMGAIGRRIVRYATVEYLRDGYKRSDEYLLAPEMNPQEGDEITVYYDPGDPVLSEIGGIANPDGKDYDIVLIPFIVVGLGMLLWVLI